MTIVHSVKHHGIDILEYDMFLYQNYMLFIRITLQIYKILVKERNNEMEKCPMIGMLPVSVARIGSHAAAFLIMSWFLVETRTS